MLINWMSPCIILWVSDQRIIIIIIEVAVNFMQTLCLHIVFPWQAVSSLN